MEMAQAVHDLTAQLTTLQGNHKETVDQLSAKTRQVVALRNDTERATQQNESMADEVRHNRNFFFLHRYTKIGRNSSAGIVVQGI